jgi:hypothetical protein
MFDDRKPWTEAKIGTSTKKYSAGKFDRPRRSSSSDGNCSVCHLVTALLVLSGNLQKRLKALEHVVTGAVIEPQFQAWCHVRLHSGELLTSITRVKIPPR